MRLLRRNRRDRVGERPVQLVVHAVQIPVDEIHPERLVLLRIVSRHEPLSVAQIAGGVIVLAGIYVVNRVEGRRMEVGE